MTIQIIFSLAGFLAAAIPSVIGIILSIRARFKAKTDAEAAKAEQDLTLKVNEFVKSAEDLYAGVDSVLKARGGSAGSVKKDSVLSKLQAYAINNGYAFDAEKWSERIDETVKLTKDVNAK